MGNKVRAKNLNQLSDLKILLSESDLIEQKNEEQKQDKEKYQEDWKRKISAHRKMVAKKNRRWLLENNECELKEFKEFPEIYQKILSYINDDKKRKYIIHIITNFFPLNKTKQVVLFREENIKCPLSDFELTDMKGILTGNRNKHIAFSGENSDVFLSGIALLELNRLVLEYTYQFDTREGQIINHALDELRNKSIKNKQ